MPEHSRNADKKHFTVEEANKALPLVKAIVGDLVRTFREVSERRERLALIKGDEKSEAPAPYREEVEHIEQELDRDIRRLQEYVGELQELGVEPKNFVMGLVDFPTVVDGQEAYLCWHLNEPEVSYWHSLEAGFAGRQPVTPQCSAADESGASAGEQEAAAKGRTTTVEP